MLLSRYFLPILKETPKEAEIVSHRLMLRAGMLRQQAAGIYSWLPLGLRVLKKIEQIVREEQNRAGALEVLMPTIQSADLWRESGRYDDYGKEMLRIVDRHERDMLYGPTNEEMITDIFRAYVRSYRDLPLNLYHIQWKFRDEVRPRFGVMRGREFLMKDAYSFDLDFEARAPRLQPHVRRLSAHLRAARPEGDPDARRFRPDRRRPQPRVRHPRRHRRERRLLRPRAARARRAGRGHRLPLRPVADRRALDGALRRDRREARRGRLRGAARRSGASPRAASRSATSSISAPNIPSRCGRRVAGPDGAERAGPHGLLRRRRVAARRRHHRGEPRRCRHHLAGQRRAVRGRPDQPEARRRGDRRGRRRPADARLEQRRHLGALRRHRPAGRREIRHDGPDRPALAADRRPARRRGRRGGDQAPRHRRARDARHRRRRQPPGPRDRREAD